MKKLTSILLLLLFIFNIIGVVVIFKIQQYQIKRELKHQIKNGVPENELTQIRFTQQNAHQFNWEHSREFMFKKIMYDIVKSDTLENNTIIFYCVTDTQETILFANINEEIGKTIESKNKGRNPVKIVFKLLSNSYYKENKIDFSNPQSEIKLTYSKNNNFYISPDLDNISSPPENLVI